MSAFIVDDQVINRILSAIDYSKLSGGGAFEGIPKPYGETLLNTEPAELGQLLRDINTYAVMQRYPGSTPDDIPGPMGPDGKTPAYSYTWAPYPTIMQLYKDLSCLRYQLTEGDTPQRRLYQEIDEYYNDIAHTIVKRLPEWEKATWN